MGEYVCVCGDVRRERTICASRRGCIVMMVDLAPLVSSHLFSLPFLRDLSRPIAERTREGQNENADAHTYKHINTPPVESIDFREYTFQREYVHTKGTNECIS